jgi:hypothetical protein
MRTEKLGRLPWIPVEGGTMNTQRFSRCSIPRISWRLRSRIPVGFIGVAALLAGGSASAQRTTGEIIGTVTDNSGAVLPGVTVELTGEHMPGSQRTVTSDRS